MTIHTEYNIGDTIWYVDEVNKQLGDIVVNDINIYVYKSLSSEPLTKIRYSSINGQELVVMIDTDGTNTNTLLKFYNSKEEAKQHLISIL